MARVNMPLDSARRGREAAALEADLRKQIVGQEEALARIVDAYQMFLTGMSVPGRPVASFLFLGPTGSGKTRTVEATAEALLGNPQAVVKIDCAEFQHSHEIAKLIGSPPGYLGHRETHPLLSQEMLDQHHTENLKLSFVLFDEIEKASDAVWKLLLGILDKATLTLGDNRRVNFSRSMIFLTSNLGAKEMTELLAPKWGFAMPGQDAGNATAGKVSHVGVEAARRRFTPEFVNRLDKIVVFKPLGEPELRRIVDIELAAVQDRILHSGAPPFVFTVSGRAKDFLLREGTDPRYGARHLKRAIERLVVQPISNLLASEQVSGGDWLAVDVEGENGRIVFFKRAEGLALEKMAEVAAAPPPLSAAA